ncbi:homoserine kinase [Bacteroidia bacterium]|nr:homoserine kinase [Bacteroidia bacterium]
MFKNMKIIVPATSANLGCGFDSIGVALNLYLELDVLERTDKWVIVSDFGAGIPKDETNLIVKTALSLAPNLPPRRIVMKSNVPLTRGLGSSSTAIVGGILLANELAHLELSKHEMLNFASKMEGHPDNVAPAILGGLVVGCFQNGKLDYAPMAAPDCAYIAFVPNYSLPTAVSRGVLPKTIDFPEAVTASAISNVMVASLTTGNLKLAGKLMEEDRFHEKYRDALVPELEEVRKISHECGAYACVLSGAGPTILVLSPKEYAADIRENLAKFDAQVIELQADAQGARVL